MIWRAIAWIVSRPAVAAFLIARAQRTPYIHLDGYMSRWWLFNPYDQATHRCRFPWFPLSVRVHHILREDHGRDPHDHPWNARTIILRGGYAEERDDRFFYRRAGDTATLRFGEFHKVLTVSPGGVFTLFITGRYRGKWGFRKPNGLKVPHDEYLDERTLG